MYIYINIYVVYIYISPFHQVETAFPVPFWAPMPSLRRRRPLSKMEVSIGKVIGKCGKIHHKFNKWRC